MKRRFFCLCLIAALVVCGLAGARLARGEKSPPAGASPAPSRPAGAAGALAFFGSSEDPWCEPFFQWLDQWAREQGWELIAYDCKGLAGAQTGQTEDLLRRERADCAVFYPVGDQARECVEALDRAGVEVVVLRGPGGDAGGWDGVCSVAPAADEPYAAAADYFAGTGGVVLVAELPDDPWVDRAREVLERAGVSVAGYGACWGDATYAREYLSQALAYYPRVGGVLAAGRAGAVGAKEALSGREDVKVLCLEQSRQATEELALGRLDAVAEVDPQEAMDALAQALTALGGGKEASPAPLGVHIRDQAPSPDEAPSPDQT